MFGGSSVLKHVQRYDEQKLAKNRKVLLLSIKKRFCYFLKYTFYIKMIKKKILTKLIENKKNKCFFKKAPQWKQTPPNQ